MNKINLISVVTATLNSAQTLADTLRSVSGQLGVNVEHIIKDGGSRDATVSIARDHAGPVRVIERSDRGIYDAMNQGFAEARGDIVCFLNSDDYFVDDSVLRDVATAFETSGSDIVYGDLEIIGEDGKVLRRWQSGHLSEGRLRGMQLPHPSFFVRRDVLARLGHPFDPGYRIAADLKQQVLLINRHGARAHYLQRTLVRMRHGGASSRNLRAIMKGWKESARAYHEATGENAWIFVAQKVARKLPHLRGLRREK